MLRGDKMTSRGLVSLFVVAALAVIAACSKDNPAAQSAHNALTAGTPASDSSFRSFASIKEIMDSTIDPAADGLWEAVATNSTSKGIEEKQPRTDEEWKSVRRHAVTLIEATNLLLMQDRNAAPAGTLPGLGEMSRQEIDEALVKDRKLFNQFAIALRIQAISMLDAIDKKDVAALLDRGGDLDAACEACHKTFWYPVRQPPST
jgi:hypothetical protein